VEKQVATLLSAINDQNLLKHWNSLTTTQQNHLFAQLQSIDIPTLRLQQQLIETPQIKKRPITSFTNYSFAGNKDDKRSGQELIAKGKVGCLIVAGGQGTRLHIDGPKGKCQVTKIRKKNLFQLFAEKTLAAGKQAGRALPIAIMTSPLNHEETVAFFQENAFFGLNPGQLSFFQQETLPLLTQQGNLLFEAKDSLATGPDGNGGALHQFVKEGLWQDWYSKGIRYLNFVLIDNALADPFDAELIGFQQRMNSDIVIKCIERQDPEESVGIIVRENGKTAVVEYSELSNEERSAMNPDHTFRHPLANLSLFSFTMEFINQAVNTTQPVLHKAFKAVTFINAEQPMAWKFEKFIFDLLPFASKVDALVYPRQTCFAPLKNFKGKDSFETVADALEKSDQQIFSMITGLPCEITPLEISQDFYYPTEAVIKKWKGRTLNESKSGYIEA
jgi:UDP-N-acetylglucosamine/UDP-N-acetylgalactosamine diphosphorylase